jgi:hypothetical protein
MADGYWQTQTQRPHEDEDHLDLNSDGKEASKTARADVVRYKLEKPKPNALADESDHSLPLHGYQGKAYLTGSEAMGSPSLHQRRQLRNSRSDLSTLVGVRRQPSGRLRQGGSRTVSVQSHGAPQARSQEAIGRSSTPSPEKNQGQDDKDNKDGEPRTSMATTLAEFPVPPMQNPVGALPMLVARAAVAEERAAPVGALVDAYRTAIVAGDAVRAALDQTRARGQQLPAADWENMSAFERSWRISNEELLNAIYGRSDSWLSPADVAYVDTLAREMGDATPGWVLKLFLDDPEIF